MENRNFMTLTEDELYEVNGGLLPSDVKTGIGVAVTIAGAALGSEALAVVGTAMAIAEGAALMEKYCSGEYLIPAGTGTEPDDVCPDDWDGKTWNKVTNSGAVVETIRDEKMPKPQNSTSSSGKKRK